MPSVLPFRALRHTRKSGVPLPGSDLLNATALRQWRAEGALSQDESPAYYVLEVRHGAEDGLRSAGLHYLLGALEPGDMPTLEEEPRPVPPLSPVQAVAADDHQVLRGLLAESAGHAPPHLEGRMDGHLFRVWRLAEPRLMRRMEQVLDEVEVRPLGSPPVGARSLVAVAPLSEPGLVVHPFHRAIRGVSTFREDTFLTLVQSYARVYDLEGSLLTDEGRREVSERLGTLAHGGYHAVLLVLPQGRGKILRFRQALDLAHIKAAPRNPTLRSLDLALLNALLLRTVLGIPEPEVAGHPQVFPVASIERLVAQVDDGTFQAGFGLNPPPLWEIRAVMEARQVLPSRTLSIEPPPPAGLLFLDEET